MFSPTPQQIAEALKSPLPNVVENWDTIHDALLKQGIWRTSGIVAALATIGVECRTFRPVHEYGDAKYFKKMYDIESHLPERVAVAKALGNIHPGDGVKFAGRGYVQITGRNNYREFSKVAGIDLEASPDSALDPVVSAKILARYLKSRGIDSWAEKAVTSKVTEKECKFCGGNGLYVMRTASGGYAKRRPRFAESVCSLCCWKMVRRLVNGGLNGWSDFYQAVTKLLQLAAAQK